MDDRRKFLQKIASQNPSRAEQAIALLWFYEQTQLYLERSVIDLIKDIEEDGFGSQNTSRLKDSLSRSRSTVRGTSKDTFRINASKFPSLTQKYGQLLDIAEIKPTSSIIPLEYVSGTRVYLERLVNQINGSYDFGFFDASAVLVRRLMESLIIEIYIKNSRTAEIKNANGFFQLNGLITILSNDGIINTSRNLNRGMNFIKDIGDVAAHDRTYITPRQDIDDNKTIIRRTINELLILSGINS